MASLFNCSFKVSIYLLVFLLPLFFLPFSFEAFEFNKQYLLFFLVSLAFFFWIAKMILVDKEIRFKRTPLDIPVLVFLFIAILSAIFSVDKSSSWFGFYGRFSDGLIGILSLGVLYFLITNNVGIRETDTKQDVKLKLKSFSINSLIGALMWSVFFVVLMSYLSIFGVWGKLNSLISLPQVMLQRTFNPVSGSMEGLAVFLAVVMVFLVGRILVGDKGRLREIPEWLLLFACLVLLLIIDFTPAWIVLLVSLALMVGISLWTRMFREKVNRLLLPIFLVIIAALLIFVQVSGFKLQVFGQNLFALPQEQVLGQEESWRIGFRAATENVKAGFLGSGIGTWHYDFSKFKSVEFNQTRLWQIRFDRAGSHIAEIVGTMGWLGILSYLALIGLFLMVSWLWLLKLGSKQLPLLMTFLALVVGQFVYYQNTTLAFAFWLVLGLSVVSWKLPIKEKAISFKTFPELSLLFTVLIIILGLGIAGMYFFFGKWYWADICYKNNDLEKAAKINPGQPQYKMVLARTYLNKVLAEMRKPAAEQDQAVLSVNVARAITYAKGGEIDGVYVKGATELAPNRVSAWETLGMVYRDIQGIATGASEWGIKSFEKAISLEPTNPVLHTELGKLYLVSGDTEKAKNEFTKVKELKPDYIDASIQMALIFERENNLNEAIRQMESLANSYPFNLEVLFQLGRLYFNNNQVDEAIGKFQTVISLMPNHSNALYSLGIAYQAKGEIDLAIESLEKVLELNPGNQDLIRKLEELKK